MKEPSTRQRLQGIARLYPVSPRGDEVEVIEDAVILLDGERIFWVGARSDAPEPTPNEQVVEMGGAIVTPGWIDCHTHVVWAGSRQGEFRQRLEGRSYTEISAAGGGIMSTARSVRAASLDVLVDLAKPRLERMLAWGVTTAEVKSGYGLDTASELRMLRAAKQLGESQPIELSRTFLGAHTVPVEHRPDRARYLDLVCEEMIPQVQAEGLAEACDVFVEEGAFSLAEAERVLRCGLAHGLMPRVHADQLSAGGGAELAASLGAASADHLEEVSPQGIRALAEAGVVACLIPGSTFCLGQNRYAPARAMLEAGCTIAIATDVNPGTTCSENLALMGTLACAQMRLTPMEVLRAITHGAACSLRRQHEIGSIQAGFLADLTVLNAPDVDYIFYHYGVSHVSQVWKRGQQVWSQKSG